MKQDFDIVGHIGGHNWDYNNTLLHCRSDAQGLGRSRWLTEFCMAGDGMLTAVCVLIKGSMRTSS